MIQVKCRSYIQKYTLGALKLRTTLKFRGYNARTNRGRDVKIYDIHKKQWIGSTKMHTRAKKGVSQITA